MEEKPVKEAISLVFKEGGKVWVFKRSENKASHPGDWSLPSTYVTEGESTNEAANRLVKRKLNLLVVHIKNEALGESAVVDKGTFKLHMRDYEVDSYDGEIILNQSEYTEARLVAPDELYNLINADGEERMGECTKVFLKSEGII